MTMTRFGDVPARLGRIALRTEPRGPGLAVGRFLLALAQLSTLAFSPDAVLFSPVLSPPDGVRCDGMRSLSLWCLTGGSSHGMIISRIMTIGVLLAVMSGYRPRFLCVPHWYVAFSSVVAVPVPNGGERALMLASMLLIPMCLGDDRRWQWTRPRTPLPPVWRGAAFAARYALRLQLSVIYLGAVVSKLSDPLWRQGSAMFVIVNYPQAGFSASVRDLLEPVLRTYWVVAAVSWSVIGAQLVLVVLLWSGARARWWALALGSGFHVGIMFLMSLAVFGLAMIGVLAIVCVPPRRVGESVGIGNDQEVRTATVRG
ncbi:antimicrobial peptide system SdpB family protein [Lentzea atacamensis]|uniref:Antimicrobial peptide system SdpB family protein n=2 Tax=Lentzea atacamensis TaxID=531938 RepID=A0ABX9DUS3_9PSEU|nr:antimicrobial peptide system SdpB family protein [Lentzea atacamensis]